MERFLARELARNDRSLVAFYPFHRDLNDHSGRRRCFQSGGPFVHRSNGGRCGLGVSQDPYVSSQLVFGHNGDFDFDRKPFTVSFWVYCDDLFPQGFATIVAQSASALGGWTIELWDTGVRLYVSGNVAAMALHGTCQPIRGWTHIVVSWDGGNVGGVNFYANGRKLPRTNVGVGGLTPADHTASGVPLTIGSVYTYQPFYFDYTHVPLTLRLFRVYRRALGGNEVASLYRREYRADTKRTGARKVVPHSSHFGMTQYVRGHASLTKTATLYTKGLGIPNATTPLYLAGPAAGHFPLFVYSSADASGHAPLFTKGLNSASGHTPLYVAGGGSTSSGVPLYTSGSVSDSVSNMNLWVGGARFDISRGLGLFVENDQSGVAMTAPLYVAGDGVADGYHPYSAEMNLFIGRNPGAAMPLFLWGPGHPASGHSPLFIQGHGSSLSEVPLSAPSSVGTVSGRPKLYTHGF